MRQVTEDGLAVLDKSLAMLAAGPVGLSRQRGHHRWKFGMWRRARCSGGCHGDYTATSRACGCWRRCQGHPQLARRADAARASALRGKPLSNNMGGWAYAGAVLMPRRRMQASIAPGRRA